MPGHGSVFAQHSGTFMNTCRSDIRLFIPIIPWHRLPRISSVRPRSSCATPTATAAVAASATPVPEFDVVGKPCAVLWDLDNVCPRNARVHLLPAIQQLQNILLAFGVQDPVITCYANLRTCGMLGDEVLQQLLDDGILVQQVQAKQQAADVVLSSDACAYSRQHADKGCLVCVTHDKGFAPMLAYCTSLGVTTVLVSALPSPKYMPGLLPDLTKHRMASACTATLPWQHNKNLMAADNHPAAQKQLCLPETNTTGQPQQQVGLDVTGHRQQHTPTSADGSVPPVNFGDKGYRIPLTSNSGYWHKLSSIGCQIQYIEPWLYLNPLYAQKRRAR